MLDLQRTLEALRARASKDESGIALLSVVLISSFTFIVVMALAASSALNVNITTTSRSDMKAFHAAEAGRDEQLAALAGGTCNASGTKAATTTSPSYRWQVYRYSATGNEAPTRHNQTGMAAGCPQAGTTHVLLRVVGLDRGSEKAIESTYKWNPGAAASVTTTPQGAIVTAGRLVMSNFQVRTEGNNGQNADIILTNGNFKCEGSGITVKGSVYVQNGNVEDMQGCDGILNLSASGSVVVNKWSGVAVNGNLCAKGSIFNLWVLSTILGIVKQHQGNCPGIGNGAQGWVDYSPNLTGAVRLTESAYCNNDSNMGQPNVWRGEGHLAYFIKQQTQPTVIDLTGCPNGVRMLNTNGLLALKSDITLVANKFDLQNFTVGSADGRKKLFNVITPDNVKTLVNSLPIPNCLGILGEFKIMQVKMLAEVAGLMYSPCGASQITGELRGQLFIGNIWSNIANGHLTYVDVSQSGWGTTSTSTTGAVGARAEITLLSQIEP